MPRGPPSTPGPHGRLPTRGMPLGGMGRMGLLSAPPPPTLMVYTTPRLLHSRAHKGRALSSQSGGQELQVQQQEEANLAEAQRQPQQAKEEGKESCGKSS